MAPSVPITSVSCIPSGNSLQSLPSLKLSLPDLFVTNLRLLDLDTLPDWPDITSRTFSSKEAQQNQKSRIKCTEWALYRLFEIWDPEETREKLQPFFPPIEPLQSLNLRAALYRSLNELKRNGILGRDVTLRKTMLDDCKGDKLLEIMAVFSTIVIKRTLLPGVPEKSTSLALAASPALDAQEQSSLIPLLIAHKASLNKLLDWKGVQRMRCRQFDEMLDHKIGQLKKRLRYCSDLEETAPNAKDQAFVEKELQENWPGNSRWPQTLLYGDDTNPGDQPLKQDFHDVWAVVVRGETLPQGDKSSSLLHTLDRRVNQQEERIQKWKSFQRKLQKDRTPSDEPVSISRNRTPVRGFSFDRHLGLNLGRTEAGEAQTDYCPMEPHFQAIIEDMKNQMMQAANSRAPSDFLADLFMDHAHGPANSPESSSSFRRKPTNSLPGSPKTEDAVPERSVTSVGLLQEHTTDFEASQIHVRTPSAKDHQASSAVTQGQVSFSQSLHAGGDLNKSLGSVHKTLNDVPPEAPAVPEALADKIISDVMNAPESPVATRGITLAERTRQSIFEASRKATESSKHKNVDRKDGSSNVDPKTKEASHNEGRPDLLERTRQSLAHLPPSTAAPKTKKLSVKKTRESSQYPVNQFETPRRLLDPRRDATPTDKLFSEDAEYDSVFKSRPRIKMSPVFTPQGDEAGEAAQKDVQGYEDGEDEDWVRSSPLSRKG